MLTWKPNHYTASRHACSLADLKMLKGVEDNLSAPSSFIANTHNDLYAFYTEKGGFWKK